MLQAEVRESLAGLALGLPLWSSFLFRGVLRRGLARVTFQGLPTGGGDQKRHGR